MLFKIALLLITPVMSLHAHYSIYSEFELIASSEPVPINDMVTGWDGSYQRGEMAFADAIWKFGFSTAFEIEGVELGQFHLNREQRHYYYLNFDEETADFYRALELGKDLIGNKKLDLRIKQFEALGASAGFTSAEFKVRGFDVSIGFDVSLYKVGHFQFAELNGIAEDGDVTAASAVINYRYDDDKILSHKADVDKGVGVSFSPLLKIQYRQWQGELQLKDVANRFQWQDGAFTQGCINIGGGEQARCQAQGAGEGISAQGQINESIPFTLNSRISHVGSDVSLSGMRHDMYYRLGIEKGLQTSLGRWAFFLYYPRLIGASWQTEYVNFQFGADTLNISQARNIQLNMGVNWHW